MSEPYVSNTESEVGDLEAFAYAASLGVTRHAAETYAVGGYRYTNLSDAVTQARRMPQSERDAL